MDRLTNLNLKVEYKVPNPKLDVRGVRYYVIYHILSQSKQPTRSTSINRESPTSIIYCQKRMEFGISRNTKVWGRRRIHNTTFICGKGSSRFSVGNVEFKGSIIKDLFKKLQNDLKLGHKINNLINILSNKDFLIGCYQNIKYKSGNNTMHIDKEFLEGINYQWFDKVSNSFVKGSFIFKPLKKTYLVKFNCKLISFRLFSFSDTIVHEAMRILLYAIYDKEFRNSSHAFRTRKCCHTALNKIQIECKRVNWFIEGCIEHKYPSINPNILLKILRTTIIDEHFMKLICKYFKVSYGLNNLKDIISTKIEVSQGGLIYPVLYNIYMHSFDEWVDTVLIPKYQKKKLKSIHFEHMLRSQVKTNKKIIVLDYNFCRVYYTRYLDNFLIGVKGSKKTCELIRGEIRFFLEKRLALKINSDNIKIKHSSMDQSFFLGYQIKCTPIKKIKFMHNFNNLPVENSTKIVLNAPIKLVVKKLKEVGFINSKNMPTRNRRYIHLNLWTIVKIYKTVEKRILNYYRMAHNYCRLVSKIHYSLKLSCVLTICSKMKLKSIRKTFKMYGKNLTVSINNQSLSYTKTNYSIIKTSINNSEENFDMILNRVLSIIKKSEDH